jgi:TolA-binding protein
VKQVRQKLRTPADASSSDVITALDKAMAKPAKAERGESTVLPVAMYSADPQGEQSFAKGMTSYRRGDLASAEQHFTAAIASYDRDARYYYFRGLTRLALGRSTDADADLQQGAQRERRNLPNAAEIDRVLERMPMDVRATLNRYRGR